MPFVPVPNAALVEYRMTQDFQQVENTQWFTQSGPPDETDLGALGLILLDWWVDHYAPLASIGVALREIVCTSQHTATAPQHTTTPATLTTGALTDEALPNNVTVCVSFRTAQRGRSFRGRNYFAGITGVNVSHNTILETFAANLTDAYEAVGSAVSGSGWTWVVASRFSGVNPSTGAPIPRATGITNPVTGVVIVDTTVDSMRRRLPGRGR